MFDKISVTELAAIVICGIGLVAAILCQQEQLALAIGGGLVGYLGGVTTASGKDNSNDNT